MKEIKKTKNILKCVQITNTNPDRLNEEGKRNLGHDIMEEISIEKLTDFLRKNGYKK